MARGRKAAKSGINRRTPVNEQVPDVYREMLADAVSSSPAQISDDIRPVKRRRVGGRIVTQSNDEQLPVQSDQSSKVSVASDLDDLFEDVEPAPQQIVQTESEDSADSDRDWEEVEIPDHGPQRQTPEPEDDDTGQLNLVLEDEGHRNEDRFVGRSKRKPMTVEDKKLRLEIHKMHLCSLLVHVYLRNHWSNDIGVHNIMKKLLTKKNISYLNPDETKSQFQRSRSFIDGLTQASDAFKANFTVTARGMSKSRWADSPETLALLEPPGDIDLPMQLSDFCEAATHLEASRDVGAQLFCAMLRSAGVDARLVCSLQPLPFQPSQKVELHQVQQRANKLARERARAADRAEGTMGESGTVDTASLNDGQTGINALPVAPPPFKKRRKQIRESKYPVYWVEAFNEAVQKWVPVDPLVTKSIAKPSKFEPPAGEPENHMSYVVAFEDDGSARDVTKRYVKAYNAKTRRARVEVTNGGDKWWRRVMKVYKRPYRLDRDQVEDAELASKEAAEPMPRNVQDFKDHPYYALERHLRRHEVVHPKREVGKVGTGRAGGASALEPVYRRRDVHIVKSADKWYRLGREIKLGEQPLKRVPARKKRAMSLNPEDHDEENAGTALYGAHQTRIYSAPPVAHGRIPKNIYGNLDVYVPSMVPPGGIHIPHPETARAARTIGIDYADAVTGFVFKGRHGTAVTKGAVVAIEYREAVEEVLNAFEDDRTRAEEERKSHEALRMWKRMLAGLRIMERIEGYEVEGERKERDLVMKEEMDVADREEDEAEEGGGFLPERDSTIDAQPTAMSFQAGKWANEALDEGGGFMVEDTNAAEQPSIGPSQHRDLFLDNLDDDEGGGFLVNDDHADAEEALRDQDFGDDQKSSRIDHTLDHDSERENVQGAGGFMLEENENTSEPKDKETNIQASEPTDVPTADRGSTAARIDLPNDELEEAIMLQQLCEKNELAQSLVNTQDAPFNSLGDQPTHSILADETAEPTPADPQINSPALSPPPTEDEEAGKSPSESSSESISSKGSLLSHDPDDEDADPEWLT